MQQELLDILATAAAEPVVATPPTPIRLVTVKTPSRSSWGRQEIYGDEGR